MSSVTISGSPVEGSTLFATITSSPTPTPTPAPTTSPRFPSNIEWRFVILDRRTWEVLTFLDKIAFNRALYFELNQAAYAGGDVSSDNPEVKILHTDGDPFLSYNDRVLIGLRREGAGSGGRPLYLDSSYPWVPRFAGIISQVQRQAQADQPVTHFTAYDPLQYWSRRPVVNFQGILPGSDGLPYVNKSGSDILLDLLVHSENAHGPLYVDWGQVGGGSFYTGVIETTAVIAGRMIIKGGGGSLADAVKDLTDSGTMDIRLTPIYDPINRPGILAELSIFRKAGANRNAAIFAWDKPSRSLSGLDLLHDGSEMGNRAAVWQPVGDTFLAPVQDNPSVSFYGQWWLLTQQFTAPSFSAPAADAYEGLLALAQVEQQKLGKTTLTISPTPERSPLPWEEYWLGDSVPVYASDNFGETLDPGPIIGSAWSQLQRVQAVPFTLSDDGVETIESMLLAFSPALGPPQPPTLLGQQVAVSTSLTDAKSRTPTTFYTAP